MNGPSRDNYLVDPHMLADLTLSLSSLFSILCHTLRRAIIFSSNNIPMVAPVMAREATRIAAQPPLLVERQDWIMVTQTITKPDATLTTIVTLGPGSPTPDAPAPPVRGATTSDGLTSGQLGIILGCTIGGVALLLLICCCLGKRHQRQTRPNSGSSRTSLTDSYITYVRPSSRPAVWPQWRSIPPPVVPSYRARDPGQRWTANARASTTYVRG